MDMHTIVFAVLGLALLVGGAELLVRGASRFAAAVGTSSTHQKGVLSSIWNSR
jgi:Ca2+/Na+ antiporter